MSSPTMPLNFALTVTAAAVTVDVTQRSPLTLALMPALMLIATSSIVSSAATKTCMCLPPMYKSRIPACVGGVATVIVPVACDPVGSATGRHQHSCEAFTLKNALATAA